jgi:ADP-heptose:LPS heptosyltransferase
MNILVIRFSSLGDLVTLEPTFRALRYFFFEDKISFLTTGVGKGFYQDSNYFDEYILHKGIFSSINELKNSKFDLIINLQGNTRCTEIPLPRGCGACLRGLGRGDYR